MNQIRDPQFVNVDIILVLYWKVSQSLGVHQENRDEWSI